VQLQVSELIKFSQTLHLMQPHHAAASMANYGALPYLAMVRFFELHT
jgi:hypothetical protein